MVPMTRLRPKGLVLKVLRSLDKHGAHDQIGLRPF